MSSMVKLLCSEVGVSCHNSNEHLAFVINYLLSSNVRYHKIGAAGLTQLVTKIKNKIDFKSVGELRSLVTGLHSLQAQGLWIGI